MKLKPGTILTLVSLTITLFLIGFYLLVLAHLSKLEDIVNEKTPFVVELNDSVAQPDLFLLQQKIKNSEYLLNESLEYITKSDGLLLLEKEFGRPVLSDSSSNPLKDVLRFKIRSEFVQGDAVSGLIAEFKAMPEVAEAYFEQKQLSQLKSNLDSLNIILLISGFIFLLISVLLIYNNLKLVLRSDRFMLKTMELVGASPSFIKMPYIKKSLQIGLVASLINIFLFTVILIFLNFRFELFRHFFDVSLTVFVILLIFFIGLFFPLVFSNLLVNNYIRMTDEKRFN